MRCRHLIGRIQIKPLIIIFTRVKLQRLIQSSRDSTTANSWLHIQAFDLSAVRDAPERTERNASDNNLFKYRKPNPRSIAEVHAFEIFFGIPRDNPSGLVIFFDDFPSSIAIFRAGAVYGRWICCAVIHSWHCRSPRRDSRFGKVSLKNGTKKAPFWLRQRCLSVKHPSGTLREFHVSRENAKTRSVAK